MSWDLILRHCAAIRASVTQQQVGLELIASQLSGLEAYARHCQERSNQSRAVIQLPESCAQYPSEDCARQNEEAMITGREGWAPMCRGCGLDPRQSTA